MAWSDKWVIGPFGTPSMPIAKTDVDVVRKTKVYEKIAHQIQRLIRDGLLKPGDKLPPERELAEMFQGRDGCSCTLVRIPNQSSGSSAAP